MKKKGKAHLKAVLAVTASVLGVALAVLLVALWRSATRLPGPDPALSKVVAEQDAENPKWTFGDGHPAYAIGLNKGGTPVFKDLDAALGQLRADYADVLEALKAEFRLKPLDGRHWRGYGVYGWQMTTGDAAMREKGAEVSAFFDYFENSYVLNASDDYI